MTDAGGFRQSGGARCVDQERAIIDRDVAPFGRAQRASIDSFEFCVDADTVNWLGGGFNDVELHESQHPLLYLWRRNLWVNILAHFIIDAASML